MPALHPQPTSASIGHYLDPYNGRHPHSRLDGAGSRSSLLHPAATPHGSLTPAEAPPIDAETLFRRPGPALLHDGLKANTDSSTFDVHRGWRATSFSQEFDDLWIKIVPHRFREGKGKNDEFSSRDRNARGH